MLIVGPDEVETTLQSLLRAGEAPFVCGELGPADR
jgi:hypothetical protein